MVETTDFSEGDSSLTMSQHSASLKNVCYLNNAGQAPLDPLVKEAGLEATRRPPWTMHADEDQAAVRRLFARLIHAESKDIAIMPSTAFAISLAAMNVERFISQKRQQGGKILLLQDQMCSAVYGWQDVCDASDNVTLDIVPYPIDGGWTQAVLDRLDESVLVACLPQVHWSDGSILDLEAIGEACRRNSVLLIVDATQSVGIMPLDVTTIQPTLLACSVHKWLRGPSGMSLVYVSPEIHESWQPLDKHGRSRDMAINHESTWDASKNEMGPRGYPEKFCIDARKFDSGGKPNPILLPMVRAGLELVVDLDVANIQHVLRELTRPIFDWAKINGFSITPGPHAYHIVGIRRKSLTTKEMVDMVKILEEEGIFIAVRCGAFRISPYLDTKPSDIERLLAALKNQTST